MIAFERERRVLQTLVKGREFVAKGWVQEAYHECKGNKHSYCMLGGIARATGGGVTARTYGVQLDRDAYYDASAYLRRGIARVMKKRPDLVPSVDEFNDREGQTQERVLKAYDAAIKIAEKNLAEAEKASVSE